MRKDKDKLRKLRAINVTNCTPTRFHLVEGNRLSEYGLRQSKSTRAAIVDTHTNTATVRFDTPHEGHDYHHINVNTKGTKFKDPHWEVPKYAVYGVEGSIKAARVVGKGLLIAGVALDGARIGMAVRDDYIRYKKEKIKVPKKTIKTVSSVGGGWAGGAEGAMGGSYAGASIGVSIGALFGGVGAIPGAAIGGLIGAFTGGIGGGYGGSVAAETIADKCLDDSDDENLEDICEFY